MDKDFLINLYQAFEDAKADFEAKGVKPVAVIDRFRGQPLNPEQFEYYDLPALFIEYTIQWERVAQVYNGVVAFGFHLVTEPTWDVSNISTNKEEGMKYYTLVDCVREVLDNFRKPYISVLQRTRDEVMDAGVIFYQRLGYEAKYYPTTRVDPSFGESSYDNTVQVIGRTVVKKV